jgi:DNA replication protein DnaC
MLDVKRLEQTKKDLIEKCVNCNNGCSSCLAYCSFIEKMAISGIPADYWFREMKGFYGDKRFAKEINKYMSNIDQSYIKNKSLCLAGPPGTGKTMSSCNILKSAIIKKYSVFYITLSQVINDVISNDNLTKRKLINSDFLVLDEVDQRFFPTAGAKELFGNMFEYIMRTRSHRMKPIIMCTNSIDTSQIFEGAYGFMFNSLKSQFMTELFASGKDVRRMD